MAEAEVRALYFGELASRFTTRKQWIAGSAFVCSSGAVVTSLASVSALFPVVLSIIVAILTGYSIAVNLDRRALMMSKLHGEWNHLADDYERLWRHWYEDDAQATLADLLRRARTVSESRTEAPYEPARIEKWESFVYSRYQPEAA